MKGTLFETGEHGIQLKKAIEDIHRAPLLQSATDILNRQLKSGINDHDLADPVVGLRQDVRLTRIAEDEEASEPQVICSLGLRNVRALFVDPDHIQRQTPRILRGARTVCEHLDQVRAARNSR